MSDPTQDALTDAAVRVALLRVLRTINRWEGGPEAYTAEATERHIHREIEKFHGRLQELEEQVKGIDPNLRSDLDRARWRIQELEGLVPGGKSYESAREMRRRADEATQGLKNAQEKITHLENLGVMVIDRAPFLREVADHADRYPVTKTSQGTLDRHGGWWELRLGDGGIYEYVLAPWDRKNPMDFRVGILHGTRWDVLGESMGIYQAVPIKTSLVYDR